MAHGEHDIELEPGDKQKLDHLAWPAYRSGFVVGGVALLLALIVAVLVDHGGQKLAYAYLIAVAFALALALGSMFFVLLTHLFRAGWCVLVRRVFEAQAANLGVVAILLVPIVAVVATENGILYGWNHPESRLAAAAHHGGHDGDHGEGEAHAAATDLEITHIADDAASAAAEASHDGHAADAADDGGYVAGPEVAGSLEAGATAYYALQKRPYLNRVFFLLRIAGFVAIWAWIGHVFWKRSLKQDEDNDVRHSVWREKWSAPLTLLAALTVTFGAFDLLMSLDPAFYSTIFGVYYFAGAFLLALSWGVLSLRWLQSKGLLPSVNVEHYHDLGKLMFAFVFFWGYIAFSQYMLIWYANLPEVTYWLEAHGMSTDSASPFSGTGWSVIAIVLLFGHLLIPFAGLLSRRFKRNPFTLSFWALWLVVMCYVDLYWVARPVLSFYGVGWDWTDAVLGLLCAVGVMGVFVAGVARRLANAPLTPLHDPRLGESLALRQI